MRLIAKVQSPTCDKSVTRYVTAIAEWGSVPWRENKASRDLLCSASSSNPTWNSITRGNLSSRKAIAAPSTPCKRGDAEKSTHRMAVIRHTIAPLRAVRCIRQPAMRSFSVTARRQGGGGGESQFDPPGGWLWGIKPGEKPEPEGWEWPMYIFCGSLVVAGVALAFKPDTR